MTSFSQPNSGLFQPSSTFWANRKTRNPLVEVTGLTFNFNTVEQYATGSDLWPITWGDDGLLYTCWGDGEGFGTTRVDLGFATLSGDPPGITGTNINNSSFPDSAGAKSLGILYVDSKIYSWIQRQDGNPPTRELWVSTNDGVSWSFTGTQYTFSESLSPATFVQHGQGNGNIINGFIYMTAGEFGVGSPIRMVRTTLANITNKSAYEWFTGLDISGNPTWGTLANAKPVMGNVGGVGTDNDSIKCQISYNPKLDKYFATNWQGGAGGLRILVSDNVWGPYFLTYETTTFGGMTNADAGPGNEGLSMCFPQKWISADGLSMWAVFSMWSGSGGGATLGINGHDKLNIVQVDVHTVPVTSAQSFPNLSVTQIGKEMGSSGTQNTPNVGIDGADLGSVFDWNGKTYMAFGDTFENLTSLSGHRENTLAFTTDITPSNGITFSGWITHNSGFPDINDTTLPSLAANSPGVRCFVLVPSDNPLPGGSIPVIQRRWNICINWLEEITGINVRAYPNIVQLNMPFTSSQVLNESENNNLHNFILDWMESSTVWKPRTRPLTPAESWLVIVRGGGGFAGGLDVNANLENVGWGFVADAALSSWLSEDGLEPELCTFYTGFDPQFCTPDAQTGAAVHELLHGAVSADHDAPADSIMNNWWDFPNVPVTATVRNQLDGSPYDGGTLFNLNHAKELFSSITAGRSALPTHGVSVGTTGYLYYMQAGNFSGGTWDVDLSSVQKSTDDGQNWTRISGLTWFQPTNFAQVGIYKNNSDGFIYFFGIPQGRLGGVKLMRVAIGSIETKSEYEYLTSTSGTGVWQKNNESAATFIVRNPVGELSVAWNDFLQSYIMLYLTGDFNSQWIEMRTSKNLWGIWSKPVRVTTSSAFPCLYAPFTKDSYTDNGGKNVYFRLSRFCPGFNPYSTYWIKMVLEL